MRNARKSLIKRARKSGFLNRQNTRKGRKIHASKRRAGRCVNVSTSY